MQIELDEKMQDALEKAAAAAGMSISRYANLLMEEQLVRDSQKAKQRVQAIDVLIEHMKTATSASGRDGRRWREFIHEGHAE
jgi:hypothetical protein